MLDLADFLLLHRGIPADDRMLTFRRIDGDAIRPVIYFLPWHTALGVAWHVGLTPLDFLACNEMPPAIVSSELGSASKRCLALLPMLTCCYGQDRNN